MKPIKLVKPKNQLPKVVHKDALVIPKKSLKALYKCQKCKRFFTLRGIVTIHHEQLCRPCHAHNTSDDINNIEEEK